MSSSIPGDSTGTVRFGVVDLETSGLTIERHRILQIGLVTVDVPIAPPDVAADAAAAPRFEIVDRWSTMVRLRWPWQRVGPRRVHGIRRRDLRGAPRLDDTLAELGRRLDGAIFTAHNAAFDGGFLERAARREDVALDLGPRLCTLRMSRRLDPERRASHRLGDLCERYGVALDRPHDALDDALATAGVLPHLLRAHDISDAADLNPFYDRSSRPSPSGSPTASPTGSPAASPAS